MQRPFDEEEECKSGTKILNAYLGWVLGDVNNAKLRCKLGWLGISWEGSNADETESEDKSELKLFLTSLNGEEDENESLLLTKGTKDSVLGQNGFTTSCSNSLASSGLDGISSMESRTRWVSELTDLNESELEPFKRMQFFRKIVGKGSFTQNGTRS